MVIAFSHFMIVIGFHEFVIELIQVVLFLYILSMKESLSSQPQKYPWERAKIYLIVIFI
jgi:hypothetical protein